MIYLGLALVAAGLFTAFGAIFVIETSLNRFQSPTRKLLWERFLQLRAVSGILEREGSANANEYKTMLDQIERDVFHDEWLLNRNRTMGPLRPAPNSVEKGQPGKRTIPA